MVGAIKMPVGHLATLYDIIIMNCENWKFFTKFTVGSDCEEN